MARARYWHWVEESESERVVFVGPRTKALAYYKRQGGEAGGFSLVYTLLVRNDGRKRPRPVVGETWDETCDRAEAQEVTP